MEPHRAVAKEAPNEGVGETRRTEERVQLGNKNYPNWNTFKYKNRLLGTIWSHIEWPTNCIVVTRAMCSGWVCTYLQVVRQVGWRRREKENVIRTQLFLGHTQQGTETTSISEAIDVMSTVQYVWFHGLSIQLMRQSGKERPGDQLKDGVKGYHIYFLVKRPISEGDYRDRR
jgi:hypothetical protein